MRSRVLVTGSQGLLGRILCQGLAVDYNVYGIDIKASDYPHHYQVDIADLDALTAVFQEIRPDFLLHLAASTRALNDFDDNLHNNIIGTRNVYTAAVRSGVKRVVYASSNQVVHAHESECPDGFSIRVHAAPRPTSYYACSKLFGEALARYHYESDGLESICLRVGTVTETDLPPTEGRIIRTWLSQRDLLQITRRSLQSGAAFGIFYAVSGNAERLHDISGAQAELCYIPLDNGAAVGVWDRTRKRISNRLLRYTGGLQSCKRSLRRMTRAQRHGGTPVRLEQAMPARRGLFRMTVQEGLVVEVFWKSLQSGKGPALSVFVGGEEFAKFDCFGPGKGHYHLALSSPTPVRQQRIRFIEDVVADQISRTIFEVENNLGYYLERAANPVSRNFDLQQDRLLEVLPEIEARLRRFLIAMPELRRPG